MQRFFSKLNILNYNSYKYTEYIKFYIAFFVFLFTFKNKIDLSFSTHLLEMHYNSLEKIFKNIQLHINTQRYAICCFYSKKLSYTRLLEIYYLYFD